MSSRRAEERQQYQVWRQDKRGRGCGAAVGTFYYSNVLEWRLLNSGDCRGTAQHRRRMWRRNSRPGADELRRISCDRIYQLWSRSVRLRHLSLHRAIRAAGVDTVQLLLIMCNDGHVWTKHLHRWSKLVCWYASEVSPLYHAVWL